jgi:hypothetical protein
MPSEIGRQSTDLIRSDREKRTFQSIISQLERSNDIYEAEKIIRESKFSLTLKRSLLNEEKIVLEKRENDINYLTSSPISLSPLNKLRRRFIRTLNETLLSPFKYCINNVQNSLGTDVSSHFQFNSWIILHNIITFFIILLPFICVPHIIMIFDDVKYSADRNVTKFSYRREEETFCVIKNSSLKFNALDILVADVSFKTNI